MTIPLRETGGQMVKRGDESVGTSAFTQGVPAFWFARSLEYGGSETLYRPFSDSVWVQSAIKKVTRPISSIEVQFSKPSKSSIAPRSVRRRVPQPPAELNDGFMEFLAEPVSGLGWEDFVEASIGWMKLAECFWLLDDALNVPFPDVAGGKAFPKIIIARPDRMRAVVENGLLIGWNYRAPSGKEANLLPNQVIRLMNWNPYDDWRGLGEYKSASVAAESDWLAGKFSRNLMANNGDFGGIIIAKTGVPTEPQREQIIAELRAKRAAQLRGEMKYTFMTGDIDVKEPTITSVDAPFIQQRIESRHEIATAFGVPMSMFDIQASYSIGSASDMYQLITGTCMPAGDKLCSAIERMVFLMTGQRVTVTLNWDEHYVMQAVRRERIDTADKLWSKGMPMKKVSDYLALDLPRFDGDDTGFIPINVSPITNEDGEVDRPPAPDEFSESDVAAPGDSAGENADAEAPPEIKAMLAVLGRSSPVARSPKNKHLWETHMRQRAAAVKQYQNRASKIFNVYRAKALKHLAAAHLKSGGAGVPPVVTKSLLDIIFDPTGFGRDLVSGLNPVTQSVVASASSQLLSEVGKADDPWKFPPKAVLEFVDGREGYLKGVGQTARAQLNTAIHESVEAGEGTEQLTSRIKGVFNNLSKFEARRIAMTETSAAYGFSRHKTMLGVGIKYKCWISSHGPNVREAHQIAEDDYGDPDSAIPVDEPFIVDGEELMHPGDESGSAGNIINCQCIELAAPDPNTDES